MESDDSSKYILINSVSNLRFRAIETVFKWIIIDLRIKTPLREVYSITHQCLIFKEHLYFLNGYSIFAFFNYLMQTIIFAIIVS